MALSTPPASAGLGELAPLHKQYSASGDDDTLLCLSGSLSSLCFKARCLVLNPQLKIVFLLFSSHSLALLLITNLHNSANFTCYKSL